MPRGDNLAPTREDIFARKIRMFPRLPKILSEGDSWFDLPFPGRNIIDQFITHFPDNASWLRLETSGDEIHEMLSDQFDTLRGKMVKYKFDVILISGGGNDIVSENLPPLLKRKTAGMTAEDCVNATALNARLDRIEVDYGKLLQLRNDHQIGCPILTHSYDYSIPQDRGARLLGLPIKGPWILPHLVAKGITNPNDQKAVVRILMDRFHERIAALGDVPTNKFFIADTRGTVTESEWGDELHPTERGFMKIAAQLLPLLRRFCPGRFQREFPLG